MSCVCGMTSPMNQTIAHVCAVKLYLVRLPCLVLGVGSIHYLWLCSGEEDQWVSLCTGPEEGEEQEVTVLLG